MQLLIVGDKITIALIPCSNTLFKQVIIIFIRVTDYVAPNGRNYIEKDSREDLVNCTDHDDNCVIK